MDIAKKPREQTFFNLHTDDVISMTWKEDKSAIFTGEMGAKPTIYQWDSTGNMIQKYKGVKKGVSAIGVNEKYLAAAGMDDDHYIYLFEVGSGKLVCSEKGGR
jgi:microtubule-associated protein-like 6